MAVSNTTGLDGNYLNLSNELESFIQDKGKDQWTAATQQIGSFANTAEANLIAAFSLPDDPEQRKLFAPKLGLAPDDAAKLGQEGIQLVAKTRYERAQRMLATLSNVLDSVHQAMMRMINNIRA